MQPNIQSTTRWPLPYAILLANKGWEKACTENKELRQGLNIVGGDIVYPAVAETFGLPMKSLDLVMNSRKNISSLA